MFILMFFIYPLDMCCCCYEYFSLMLLVLCSTALQTFLQNLERVAANVIGRRSHVRPERTDDFDCTVCLKLLYEPVTTPCGHSFCRSCLFQSTDRGQCFTFVINIFFLLGLTCYFIVLTFVY